MEGIKAKVGGGLIFVIIILALIFGTKIVETVEKGTYQVKQAAITGNMTAKMTPGMYGQWFGDILVWPKAETFYFTADVKEGKKIDQSIEVRFNDGSICNISGTCRVVTPITSGDAISLIVVQGFRTYNDMEHKLILPAVRNALRLTANLMSARESYSERRSDFIYWAWDQIQNGAYETVDVTREVKDLITGEKMSKVFKDIKTVDGIKGGIPLYQKNPLQGLGLRLSNFEIKSFVYAKKVKQQIATQQEALMAVATAKANAQRAEQEKITAEAEGKKAVMTAKYIKEEEKIRAVVDAQKDKVVAETHAAKKLAVAILDKKAAEQIKQKEILLGQGEAKRKELVLAADGALKQKLATYEKVMTLWADAYSKRLVPAVMIGGSGGGDLDTNAIQMSEVLGIMALRQLGLDFTVPKGATIITK